MTAPPRKLYAHSHTRLTRRYITLSQYENATIAMTAALTHSAGHNAPDSDSNT